MYNEFKDIFEGNKLGFDGKSRPFTHFVAFEEHVAGRQSSLANRRETQCVSQVKPWRKETDSVTSRQYPVMRTTNFSLLYFFPFFACLHILHYFGRRMEKRQVRIQISLAWDQRPIDVRRICSIGGQRAN